MKANEKDQVGMTIARELQERTMKKINLLQFYFLSINVLLLIDVYLDQLGGYIHSISTCGNLFKGNLQIMDAFFYLITNFIACMGASLAILIIFWKPRVKKNPAEIKDKDSVY